MVIMLVFLYCVQLQDSTKHYLFLSWKTCIKQSPAIATWLHKGRKVQQSSWCVKGTKSLSMFWAVCPPVLGQQNHYSVVHLCRKPCPVRFWQLTTKGSWQCMPEYVTITQGTLLILKARM